MPLNPSIFLQRVAVSTAANICRQLPSDAADFVTEAVPLLTNLLQYQDSKVKCCSRIFKAASLSAPFAFCEARIPFLPSYINCYVSEVC